MTSITVRDLWKNFGAGEPVLRDCTLEIKDHEFMVLVGPSGSAKDTTLLRMISGLEAAMRVTSSSAIGASTTWTSATGTSRWSSRTTGCTPT
jgi:ABC-type nitrate/sulfonate/bicarbonate transport system ATPase subunit